MEEQIPAVDLGSVCRARPQVNWRKPLVKRRLERAKQVGLLGMKHVTENM